MKKTKPLIVVVYCGKGWILNRMANLIKDTLKKDYDVLISYSGALQERYGGNPEYFKKLPIDGYCNLVAMDTDMKYVLNGNEVVVSTVHHWVDDEMYNELYPNFIESNYIITDSDEWKDKLIKNGIKIPIQTIPAFVDKKFFKKVSHRKNDKIALGTFCMIHGNPENDRKGVKHLIALSKYIKEQNLQDKFKFVISGDGWSEIIKQINNYNIEVEYEPLLSDDEMPKMYAKLDFYLMLSDVEGGPFSVMEAMAERVMVISNNIGIVKDIGIDKQNIAIIDNSNSKQILDTILYYYNNKEEYNKIINDAYKVALNHTPEKVYSKYIDIFNSLIDRNNVKYDDSIDLNKIQKYLNNFGKSIINGRKIKSNSEKILKHIPKPLLRLLKNITPIKSWKKTINRVYKEK